MVVHLKNIKSGIQLRADDHPVNLTTLKKPGLVLLQCFGLVALY